MSNKEFNPYELLGVSKDTSLKDIKRAYKDKSKECHPDTGGSVEEFNQLKKAFDILSNPEKRKLYDEYGMEEVLDVLSEAKLVATQIVIQAVEGLPLEAELDDELIRIFKKCLNDLETQERKLKKQKEKISCRINNIQEVPDDDFLFVELNKFLQHYEKQINQTKLNYKIHDTAFQLVKAYKFDITKIPFMEKMRKSEEKYNLSRKQKNLIKAGLAEAGLLESEDYRRWADDEL